MEPEQRLKSAMFEVVQNQLDSNDPPETKQTLDRLIAEGFSREEAKELIGTVVIAEVFEVMNSGKPYDKERYVAALNKLPEVPE
jgi:hypothetical protein